VLLLYNNLFFEGLHGGKVLFYSSASIPPSEQWRRNIPSTSTCGANQATFTFKSNDFDLFAFLTVTCNIVKPIQENA